VGVAKQEQRRKTVLGRKYKVNCHPYGPGITENDHTMEGILSRFVKDKCPTDGPGELGYARKAWTWPGLFGSSRNYLGE